MRVLIVANHNTGTYTPFILEQVDALRKHRVEIDYFGVHGKGFYGYLSNLAPLKTKIETYKPDIIHAHYGLSGLLANLQRKTPVVTTYHGSDVHSRGQNLFLSRIAMRLSAYNIFVSKALQNTAGYYRQNQCIQPCGVDMTTIYPIERSKARNLLGWDNEGKYVLFAASFDNDIKNSRLAKDATTLLKGVHLVELCGYTREQVNLAMNAANCLLMTSFREGSPQVVKEALACGTPIVSVEVGDVKDVTSGIEGCYITNYDANELAASLNEAIAFQGKTKGPQRISDRGLSNEQIAKRILKIYEKVIE